MNPLIPSIALCLALVGCANAPSVGTRSNESRAPDNKASSPSAPTPQVSAATGDRSAGPAPSARPPVATPAAPQTSAPATATPSQAQERKPAPSVSNVADPKQVSIMGLEGTYDMTAYSDFYGLVADLRSHSPGSQHGVSWSVIGGLVGSFQQANAAANRARRDAIAQKEEADQLSAAKAKFRDSVIDTWGKHTLKAQPAFKIAFAAAKQDMANWYKDDLVLIIPNRTESLSLNAALGDAWAQQISKRIGSSVAPDGLPRVDLAWISSRARDSRDAGLHLPASIEQAKRIRDAVAANRTLYVVVNQYNWRVSGTGWLVMRLNPLSGSIVDESGKPVAAFGTQAARIEARTEKPMKSACRKNESEYISGFCPMTTDAFRCVFAKKDEYKKLCVD